MAVKDYQVGSGYSFPRPVMAADTLLIQTPAGSELLPVATVGPRLFVPGVDRLVRLARDAGEVVRASRGRQRAFRVVGTGRYCPCRRRQRLP